MQRFLFMHWLLGTGMRRGGTCLIVCFLLVLPLFAGPVGSHDASALTVNIKESNIEPNTANILLGDSVYWINLDSRENVTHRIVHDSDGDGLYNGSNDWDSGILLGWTSNGTCIDDTGNKTPGCAVTFELYFNDTSDIGTYEYVNLVYLNETLIEDRTFTVTVKADIHLEAINTYCFGTDCEDDNEPLISIETSSENEKPYWLLYVSGITGSLALLLAIKLIFFPPSIQLIENKIFQEE